MPTTKEKEELAAKKEEAADKKELEDSTKAEEARLTEPFEASNVKIKGELLQGDSFRVNVTKGNLTIHIPVPVEGTNNVNVLKSAFRLIEEAIEVKNEKEMRAKFGSLIS